MINILFSNLKEPFPVKLDYIKPHQGLRSPHPIQLSQIFSIFIKRDALHDKFFCFLLYFISDPLVF